MLRFRSPGTSSSLLVFLDSESFILREEDSENDNIEPFESSLSLSTHYQFFSSLEDIFRYHYLNVNRRYANTFSAPCFNRPSSQSQDKRRRDLLSTLFEPRSLSVNLGLDRGVTMPYLLLSPLVYSLRYHYQKAWQVRPRIVQQYTCLTHATNI